MNADEINEGLARYMWAPDYYPVVGSEEIFAAGELWDLFTDSLDACERVADKLGVWHIGVVEYGPPGDLNRWRVEVSPYRPTPPSCYAIGPTRAHAFAAALWAAVQEQQNG